MPVVCMVDSTAHNLIGKAEAEPCLELMCHLILLQNDEDDSDANASASSSGDPSTSGSTSGNSGPQASATLYRL